MKMQNSEEIELVVDIYYGKIIKNTYTLTCFGKGGRYRIRVDANGKITDILDKLIESNPEIERLTTELSFICGNEVLRWSKLIKNYDIRNNGKLIALIPIKHCLSFDYR